MPRVRFAPSPTGFLHIGSARTYIFNWLYARHTGGTMILRIDDTDVGRNTDASLTSIFEGLRWLDLGWDEEYKQSDRLALHRTVAQAIFEKGLAYRDFTLSQGGDSEKSGAHGTWLFNAGMRELSREESDRRAAAGEPFALRFRVPHDRVGHVQFADAVYGDQSKAYADIEDFALLRSDGMPTYHLANCADDADLRITHIIRGQEHLSNAFKHKLIFDAAGAESPTFAHLPLLMAPDGMKLSKRVHGPVVSVTTYRDAGFLPQAFINFLCLLGWSPKNDREKLSLDETVDLFTLEGINRANAVVNFTEEDPFDAKALWLNAEHIRSLPPDDLARELLPFVPCAAATLELLPFAVGHASACHPSASSDAATLEKLRKIAPLIQERMKLLRDVQTVADFFFADQLPPYDAAELIPKKGDAAMAKTVLVKALAVLATAEFTHDGLDAALRAASVELGIKAGQMFEPVRVAVCGRKTAPPLFGTLEVLGRETCLARIAQAIEKL
jgi:glutamyl-tRNA synthetase